MRLAIVGSRTFDDWELFKREVNKVKTKEEIVSGGARGADHFAEVYANEYNLSIKVFKADWDRYGKKAGFKRNKLIEEYSDMCIAFWDGKSRGTAHTISLFKKGNKEIKVIEY